MFKISPISLALTGMLLAQSVVAAQATTCPSESALQAMQSQLGTDKATLATAKSGLVTLKQELSSTGTTRIILGTATGATAIGTFFTLIGAFNKGESTGTNTPGYNVALGVEVIADAGLIYFDIKEASVARKLERLISTAEQTIKTDQDNLDDENATLAECLSSR
jgi:hypothetical protein